MSLKSLLSQRAVVNLLDLARAAMRVQSAGRKRVRVATSEQAAELRELIAVILANESDVDRMETVDIALADPDAALTSFRVLAADKSALCAHTRDQDVACRALHEFAGT
jgi:hypothetical protein